MIIYGATDVGRHHSTNEDSVFPEGYWPSPQDVPREAAAARGYLAAIADGVSSAGLAAEASQQVLASLVLDYYSGVELGSVDVALVAASAAANTVAWELTKGETTDDELAATTLVAAVIKENVVRVVHAGDSRAYLVTPQQVVSLTTDHSVVQELMDEGSLSSPEAAFHPESGVLTRALGVDNEVQLDLSAPVILQPEDSLVLCSDGLYTLVSEQEIGQVVRSKDPVKAARKLIEMANQRGGYDNISVVIAGPSRARSWRQRLFGQSGQGGREDEL